MNPLRVYDYLALARTRVLDAVRPLSPEQYTRRFPIGPGSLARTLTHIMVCEWAYILWMLRRDLPPYNDWPIREENPPPFPDLDAAWARQADDTRAALRAIADWTAPIDSPATHEGRPIIITATPADIFTQLALHEVHHRAQALNILRHLGVTIEDIDFNAMMLSVRDAP